MTTDRHYYLYAKHWYNKTNTMDDLLKIHSVWSGLHVDDLNPTFVINRLLELAQKHLEPPMFTTFIMDIRAGTKPDWFDGSFKSLDDSICDECLRILRFTMIDSISFRLGFPDYRVLPYTIKNNSPIFTPCFGI